jgi:molecular chaperone GrpE (heat shock protein)
MKLTLLVVMLFAFAQEPPQDSPLVKAAKSGGALKKIPAKKVITNADVKKSKGKLVVLPAKEAQSPAAPPKTSLDLQNEQRKAADSANVRVSAAEKKVGELEKELRRLEDAYYAENDPNYRDNTIQPRFNQAKKQLDDARKELADARDALQRAGGKT